MMRWLPRGELNGAHKLREQQVREIAQLCAEGTLGLRRIARRFGVSKTAIQMIRDQKNWAWLWKDEGN